MAKVLMLTHDGVEDREMLYPYYRMQEAGYTVEVVGPQKGKTYIGSRGLPFTADLSPEEVRVDDYAAVIIPGGKAPDAMRIVPGLVRIVAEAVARGKVVAAICHGPQMLIEADVLRGRRATCAPQIKTDLRNAGATYVDEPAVVDGNLVTSRLPADLPAFCKATLELLSRVPVA
ncbi:MAG TPA: type 1 glutamine amidotransferase domain-containing protein [Chloroflexota bacterium]|nr:type 1 glutamine amidotransferase domain-containing protein [Chloroflexota bacterium]HZU05268.1 type 1 glutamine amidotransferase domain-containing protein [Chloroflexota bacterium]